MKPKTFFNPFVAPFVVLVLAGGMLLASQARAQEPGTQISLGPSPDADLGTAFTYQGRLLDNGTPVDGTCDFDFGLWNQLSDGTQIGSQSANDVSVSDGYFSVSLDFGATAFDGEARYLAIAVDCGGGSTPLDPRVTLNAAPYAHSLRPGASVDSTSGIALNLSTTATSGAALNAIASAGTGNAAAVYGASSAPDGAGLSGYNSSATGYGVYGSGGGYGVYGRSTGPSTTYGVYGLAADSGSGTSFGVYGKSNSSVGTGVSGEAPMNGVAGKSTSTASTGWGVWGESMVSGATLGYGVYGKAVDSSRGRGVQGEGTEAGVYGWSSATTGDTAGVVGECDSNAGAGVAGYADATTGTTYGVYGRAESSAGTALYGHATASTGSTVGVYGQADSLSGKGVYGEGGYYGVQGYGTDPSGTSYGVYGYTESTASGSYGGFFRNTNNVGLYAEGDDGGSRSVGDVRLAGGWGVVAADQNVDSSMSLVSNHHTVVYLDNNDDDAISCFSVYDPGYSAIVPFWEVCPTGMVASGLKATTVDTPNHGQQKLYGIESPEVWFEDFGSGQLANGVAVITIDPIFAETVNLEAYHVFLTPLGDCNGLYVAAKTRTSFEVHELGDGNSNTAFDYRIVAKRLGYEDVRLEQTQQ